MQSETDNNDCLEKSAPINPSLQISSNKMGEIISSFQAVKQAALHSLTHNVGNPSAPDDSNALFPSGNTSHSREIGPKYDPHLLMFKRMVCSENVTKNRLIARKENMPSTINKSTTEEEEDETFFENLRKRISKDIQNKIHNRIEIPLPKRSSTMRKRRSVFNDECLSLMKKCRAQTVNRFGEPSSAADNGIFSLANKCNSENQENVVVRQIAKEIDINLLDMKTPTKISIDKITNLPNNILNCETDDDDFRCATPILVRNADEELET